MTIQEYKTLPDVARKIRSDVFIAEQGFAVEFDEIDDIARHIVAFDGEKPIACCRMYIEDNPKVYHIGRICVVKEYRGKNIGQQMMQKCADLLKSEGVEKLALSAQLRVKPFYEKLDYVAIGDTYYDEFCEHIYMEKIL